MVLKICILIFFIISFVKRYLLAFYYPLIFKENSCLCLYCIIKYHRRYPNAKIVLGWLAREDSLPPCKTFWPLLKKLVSWLSSQLANRLLHHPWLGHQQGYFSMVDAHRARGCLWLLRLGYLFAFILYLHSKGNEMWFSVFSFTKTHTP